MQLLGYPHGHGTPHLGRGWNSKPGNLSMCSKTERPEYSGTSPWLHYVCVYIYMHTYIIYIYAYVYNIYIVYIHTYIHNHTYLYIVYIYIIIDIIIDICDWLHISMRSKLSVKIHWVIQPPALRFRLTPVPWRMAGEWGNRSETCWATHSSSLAPHWRIYIDGSDSHSPEFSKTLKMIETRVELPQTPHLATFAAARFSLGFLDPRS